MAIPSTLREKFIKLTAGLLNAGAITYGTYQAANNVAWWNPIAFLNTYKSAQYCRFDAAYELGHVVLHGHEVSQGPELEQEANAFASVFLMPRKTVLARGFNNVTLKSLVVHKAY